MSKNKRPVDAAPTAATAKAPYRFSGYPDVIAPIAEKAGVPPHLLARFSNCQPIVHAGRVLAGLASLSTRIGSRPLHGHESAAVREGIASLEEVPIHYALAARAAVAMIEAARLAFGLSDVAEIDESPSSPWMFAGADGFVRAEADRIGVSEVVSRRALQCPELGHISNRIAEVYRIHLAAPRDAGRPVLTMSDAASVRGNLEVAAGQAVMLRVLADAADAMISRAREAFGVTPTPLDELKESPGCAPHLNATKRARGKSAPAFFA